MAWLGHKNVSAWLCWGRPPDLRRPALSLLTWSMWLSVRGDRSLGLAKNKYKSTQEHLVGVLCNNTLLEVLSSYRKVC